jgi:hypothetical protein
MDYYYWLQQYECRNLEFKKSALAICDLLDEIKKETSPSQGILRSVNEMAKAHGSRFYATFVTSQESPIQRLAGNALPQDGDMRQGHKHPAAPVFVHVRDCLDACWSDKHLDLRIDLSGSTDVIIEQVRTAVDVSKSNRDKWLFELEFVMAIAPQENERYMKEQGGFSLASIKVRAAGIWLWDRVQELGLSSGATAQAIREFRPVLSG